MRFSTVAGSKGSADLARDVRGFAVKLYTQEDNWDIVGNNIPVFFIQDAIKFPDLIHAAKPGTGLRIPARPDGPRQLLGFEGGIVRQCRLKPVCLTDLLSISLSSRDRFAAFLQRDSISASRPPPVFCFPVRP